MLIIVEHRDVELINESCFDFKTSWRTDILKIDPAKCWCNGFNRRNDCFSVLRIQHNRHGINLSKPFEQSGFSFHHRHRSLGTDIA